MAVRVRDAVAVLIAVRQRCCKQCESDSRHRGARTGSEAAIGSNRIGVDRCMIFSGRIDVSAEKRGAQTNQLTRGRACDEVQSAAFALGTGSIKCRLLLFG